MKNYPACKNNFNQLQILLFYISMKTHSFLCSLESARGAPSDECIVPTCFRWELREKQLSFGALDNKTNLAWKRIDNNTSLVFPYKNENACFGCSLKAARRATSNEYIVPTTLCFRWEVKIITKRKQLSSCALDNNTNFVFPLSKALYGFGTLWKQLVEPLPMSTLYLQHVFVEQKE